MKIDRVTLALAKKYTDEHGGGGGTSNYNSLTNKPKINNVELSGNKTLEQLGVPLDTSDLTNGAGFITENDIPAIPEKTSDLTNDSGFITKSVDDLTNYTTTSGMNTALSGKVSTSAVGTAGGVAELDNTGKVPSSQLPSYVDDVIDGYYNETDGKFYEESTYTTEITGEAGKIYISVDTDLQYRWTGSAFSALGGALVLGETSSTAYRGDRGKAAYDISQTVGDVSDLDTTDKSSVVNAINELAGKSTGHVIKDGGTAETERTGLNFIDHDITDDSTNDNTDVAPHELTSAEWGEVMPVLPGINSGGMIFDERGTEHIVGQYIHADGTKQPIYCRSIKGTTGAKDTDVTIGTIANFGLSIFSSGVIIRSNGRNDIIPAVTSAIAVYADGTVTVYTTDNNQVTRPVYVTVYYTKSTDTPV